MAWKLKDGGGTGMGKALQLSKALVAMGFTSWNRLEPGDYFWTIFCDLFIAVIRQYGKYVTVHNKDSQHTSIENYAIINIYQGQIIITHFVLFQH